jgi:hypothetical protein
VKEAGADEATLMPDRSTHRRTSIAILGDDFDYVHRWKDEPVAWLGSYHRDVRHGPLAAYKVGRRFKGSGSFNLDAAIASIIHDLEDGHMTTWLAVAGGIALSASVLNKFAKRSDANVPEVRLTSF